MDKVEREVPDINLPAIPASEYGKPGAGGIEAAKHKRQRQLDLLRCYAQTGKLPTACKRAGIDWLTHESWERNDPAYCAALKAARRMIGRQLEGEMIERALDGVEKPIVREGVVVGTYLEYDSKREREVAAALLPEDYARKPKIDDMNREQLLPLLQSLFAKAGRIFDPGLVDAEFVVRDGISVSSQVLGQASAQTDSGRTPHGGVGWIETGGPPLGGSPSPSLQKSPSMEKGPIPNPKDGTPEGPIQSPPSE